MMQLRSGLLPFLVVLLVHRACCQRILIAHDTTSGPLIKERAQKLGLSLVGEAKSLLVLEGRAQGAARNTRAQSLISRARTWPGVVAAEQDQPRYMHRPFGARTSVQSGPGPTYEDCTLLDRPISNGTWPEIQPYGIHMIQATSPKLPNSTSESGVVVCIIDSGIDSKHPDLVQNSLDGCKYEDSFAPAGCPFYWGDDMVGHGTHVGGTIAAQKNGFGVVGVIPGPAEIYAVRVFNDSGDVNQGQGLVYGSTLILAYTQCEGRLAAQQAARPDLNYRMVVSMSLGAVGPLTIEKMFFRDALSRGDILFVASSGNNGSAPTLENGTLSSMINPGNYPGAYPEVLSVSAVDCNNKLAPFSQKHPSVDIAAPGVDVLSTASEDVAAQDGDMASAFTSADLGITVSSGTFNNGNQVRHAGSGKVTAAVVYCGSDTSKPCPAAKGQICFMQYDPSPEAVEAAPQPGTRNSTSSSSNNSSSNNSSSSSGARVTNIPRPVRRSTGSAPIPPKVRPSRFYCHIMEFCMAQGAKAVLLGPPALSSAFYPSWATSNPAELLDVPTLADINCSLYGCDCWARIKDKRLLPAAGLSLRQFNQVRAATEAAKRAGKPYTGTIDARFDAYQRLSGTSMAVPHVSGGIARVWAAYPYCPASVLRTAVEQTAKDLGPKGRDVMFGHGLLQLEAAFDYLATQPCAKGPKQPLYNGIDEQLDLGLQEGAATGNNSSTTAGSSKPVEAGRSKGNATSNKQTA